MCGVVGGFEMVGLGLCCVLWWWCDVCVLL